MKFSIKFFKKVGKILKKLGKHRKTNSVAYSTAISPSYSTESNLSPHFSSSISSESNVSCADVGTSAATIVR